MLIESVIFYGFALLFIGSATMVVVRQNPVHSALFLVLCFFSAAALWLFLEAEFLALVLVLVYVGAVMTLFLFVIMMLDIDAMPKGHAFVRYLPLGLLVVALLVGSMIYVIGPHHLGHQHLTAPVRAAADYSNVKELGLVLYTNFVYGVELAAVILLVAIVAAISLSLRQSTAKKQNVVAQIQVRPEDRLKMVSMPTTKPQDGTQHTTGSEDGEGRA